MEAVMGSSSSPYLKLVSSKDKNMGFLCKSLKDDLLSKSLLKSPLHHSCNSHKNKTLDFKLSFSLPSSRRGLRLVSLSSSQTQVEVENHKLQIEESTNGYIIESEAEGEKDMKMETQEQTVRVKFQLERECSFGQNFLIVGDDHIFGLWDPNNAVPLTWSDGHVWTVDLDIPIGKCIKFKFIMQESNGKFMWQPGPDRILECWETDKVIALCEDWENPDSRKMFEVDPTMIQVQGESAATADETQTVAAVAADNGMPMPDTGIPHLNNSSMNAQTKEPKGYDIVSDEGVPVLVPGLSHLAHTEIEQELVHEASKDEVESVNGAAMVSTGADIASDLKLPELNSKVDASTTNSNPGVPAISSIHENQESCESECQETEQADEEQEQDHEATQPMQSLSLIVQDNQRDKNIFQKFLSFFGIQ